MLVAVIIAALIALWTGGLAIAVALQEKRFPGKYLLQFAGACVLLVWVAFF